MICIGAQRAAMSIFSEILSATAATVPDLLRDASGEKEEKIFDSFKDFGFCPGNGRGPVH